MPDDDGYQGWFSPLLDVLVIGSIAIIAMVVIGSGVVVWFLS
ncbi:hypothetical protein [Teichococcus wenyumeiae]|nr:hypothetical protein [Pseudoroseomonas wenyumeiae]